MPSVILDLLGDGSSRVTERVADPNDAKRRASELSHRMTNLGIDHRISCLSDDRKNLPFYDAAGTLIGAAEDDPNGAAFYEADVEADYRRFHAKGGTLD